MTNTTYVMPNPQVKIVGGEFRFTGKTNPVNVNGKALDFLRAGECYNSEADVYNGSVNFETDFSVKEKIGEVDEILSLVDRTRLANDLEEKGYAILMTSGKVPNKLKDYQNKGFIANTDRVIQDLTYQKLSKELEPVRHLKTQESVDLMLSDKNFKSVGNDYWMHNLEVIQKVTEQKAHAFTMKDDKLDIVETETGVLVPTKVASFWSDWDRHEARPSVLAPSPLLESDDGVATLKKA
ncbi:MAG: hypothetical protein KJ697_02070 [Nanoarchaeota archaeon]|nr:hypothetical protein [Nanoarchaeota archaeon]MBU4124152.1 hypothetical protein [Nanoarchaeota archaeon]